MAPTSTVNINNAPEDGLGSTLVIGQAHFGMAAVTAADYLVRHLPSTHVGHLAPPELPAITPFEEGVPRHHTRLYSLDDTELAVLIGELFIPVGAARTFTDMLLEITTEQSISEILVLHGVPFPHGPEEHEIFTVATPEYQQARLAARPFEPLQGGFLDGVVGEIMTRSLAADAPDAGVFLTPTHPPGPDIEAALRLIGATETVYDFDVDETELEELAQNLQEYYEQLADRMTEMSEGVESPGSHDYPEDRMYM